MKTKHHRGRFNYLATVSILLMSIAFAGVVGCNTILYSLTISTTEGGAVITPGVGVFTYNKGKTVNLVAEAEEGYTFIDWTGDVGTMNDVNAATSTITMNADYTITANFAREIWDWHDLDAIRDDLGGNYILMNNLDYTSPSYEDLASPTANEGKGWQPIGTWIYGSIDQPFTGSFDGQGYEISDLFINRPDGDNVALFGYVGCGAVVKNIGVVNATVTGDYYVGGLVGYSAGNVTACYVTGSVTGAVGVGGLVGVSCPPEMTCSEHPGQCTISDCYSTGSVTGDYSGVGGLVGVTSGPVTNSHSTSTVTCSGDWVGGLVGVTCDDVSGCYAAGSVVGNSSVGGLVGAIGGAATGCPQPGGSLNNSYAVGNATGDMYVGGLVGFNDGPVTNCYSVGNVAGNSSVGGLLGHNYQDVSNSFWDTETSGQATSDGGTGMNTAEMKNIYTFSGPGWNIFAVALNETNPTYIWNIVNNVTYPFLSWQS